ncbi:hypothetical protein PR048_004220 [Dryococelus australis]|uniref:Uncharacterized protein n=1 Tax=Dryococelus australis TaxID=614101 RepID=A0ABQ9I4X9_9NEOP|nr:hypothetical protein PR048_004220 [Dryococelus australis]
MNLLHALRDEEFASQDNRRISPLRAWLCAHASTSLDKYLQLEAAGFHTPLTFQAETPMRRFVAYIDPEDKFAITDKLSQVSFHSLVVFVSASCSCATTLYCSKLKAIESFKYNGF